MATSSRRRRWTLAMCGLLLVAGTLLSSCAELGYYRQAFEGQWRLIENRQSLNALLTDDGVDTTLRQRLRTAAAIRRFASRELGLPDNASYTSYVDVGRPHVVYNVVAAPPLSLRPRQWCFPVAGCVGYRGYFDRAAAERYANTLRAQKLDVFVAGVPAYSTLGWFDDPLLSTFLHWPAARVAELIFHELAHQQVYVENDTPFNESFATAVGQLGTERWLLRDADARDRYRRYRRYREEFKALVGAAKNALAALYRRGDLDAADKQAQKVALIERLRADYATLKRERWGGYGGYDRWFEYDLNNAKFAAFGAYSRYVPGFLALFKNSGDDFAAFYRAAAKLALLPKRERRRRLEQLAARSAPAETPETVVPVTRSVPAEQPRHDRFDRGRGDTELG